MKKKTMVKLATTLAVSTAMLCSVPALAAPQTSITLEPGEEYSARLTSIIKASCGLSANGSRLTCLATTDVRSGYGSSVYIELQKYSGGSWSTIKDWYNSSSGTNAYLNESYYVTSGTYRIKTSHYSLDGYGNALEEVIKYSQTEYV